MSNKAGGQGVPGDTATRTRRYDAPRRRRQAAETRATVLAAAHRSFVEHGWAATGVRDVARAAGVSVKTVYDTFGSKADLFKTVVDVAIVGDDEPVAMMQRPEFDDLRRGATRDRVAAGARLAAAVNQRTCDLMRVWRAAADTDPELASGLDEGLARQRETATTGVGLAVDGDLEPREAEGLWALHSTEVYWLLVRQAGWGDAEYERWLADAALRLLETRPRQGAHEGEDHR